MKKHFLYSSGYFAQHFFHFLSILFIFPVFQRIAQLTLKPMLKKVSKYFAQQFFLICLAQKKFCNLLKPYGSSTLWSHRAPRLCSASFAHLLSILFLFAQTPKCTTISTFLTFQPHKGWPLILITYQIICSAIFSHLPSP